MLNRWGVHVGFAQRDSSREQRGYVMLTKIEKTHTIKNTHSEKIFMHTFPHWYF